MITLTINRDAGCNFIRWMLHRYKHEVDHSIIVGENLVELRLQPDELDLFREILIRRPDQFENAMVILRGLGHVSS